MTLNDSSAPPAELKTVRDFVRWGASAFANAGLVFAHGTDNALDEAFHLVLWALKLPADLPATYLEAALIEDERRRVFRQLQERIETRKPAAYLIGEIQFCGMAFTVDERVLIPRSPIGELIAQQFAPWLTINPERILDLCAGSGCIGIACAAYFPDAAVDLAELSPGALAVCRANIARHHAESQVRELQGDLFAAVGDTRYDLIVSNPPYVPVAEVDALAREFQHEPRMALVAGDDGMDIVARILREAPAHLADDGLLVCEIGGSRDEFDARFGEDFPAIWPEFERGGDGVFVIGTRDLRQWLEQH